MQSKSSCHKQNNAFISSLYCEYFNAIPKEWIITASSSNL